MGVMENSWRGCKNRHSEREKYLTAPVPYPTQPGQVGGHEGVGIVHKLGPGSENGRVKIGDRVGIKVGIR
jgi:propanol-preferring alcohol dehydrogenase